MQTLPLHRSCHAHSRSPRLRVFGTMLALVNVLAVACAPAVPAPGVAPAQSSPAAPDQAAPAPAPARAAASGAPSGTLTVGLSGDLESGDPFFDYAVDARTIVPYIFDNLVDGLADGKLVPGLAESWSILDPKTIEFKLRKGVTFHNGEEFNAESVKFSIERMIDPEGKSGAAPRYRVMEGVTIIDPYTVQVHLKQPDASLLRYLSYHLVMLPPKYIQEVGAQGFAQKPVGSGPFKFVEWVRGDHLTLSANENYWTGSSKGKPGVQTLIFKPIPDVATRVAALRSGQVQLIREVPGDIAASLASGDIAVVQKENTALPIIHLDTKGEGPLKDVRVRQALNYAIDVETMMKDLLYAPGTRLAAPVSTATIGYDASLKPYTYDPERARRLLAEAGYPNGFSTKLDYATRESKQVVEAIQAYLGAVGVRVELVGLEIGAFNTMWVQEQQKVAPLRFGTWNSDVDPGVNGTWLTCDGFLSRYCNPKVDELWQQQAATYDLEQRAKLVSELLKLVHDDAPQVYLYPVFEFYGVSKRVQGFEPSTNALLRVFNATVQ